MLNGYVPPQNSYDEFVDSTGQPRPHLGNFLTSLDRIGSEELTRRWRQAQAAIRDNGFAFAGAGDADKSRPWEVDPIPVLIPSAEWALVSEALIQRATVLNTVLTDLFSEQTLVRDGILPRDLVFQHPGFLRPCCDLKPANGFLHLYAADLARTPDGQWTVLADRTEAPSGLGFALENRIVISRMLPDVFEKCRVERFAPFFIALNAMLRRLAPSQRENPHIVLLSRGPQSQNYFENAYLARYLGLTLAEPGDLTVRNGQVALKTLDGLVPVDVILRRVNSNHCDPLELNGHSPEGVAGLMQAARRGKVGVANAFGCGFVESPVMMSFMPTLAKRILGQDLMMPSMQTWWCGDSDSRQYVLDNLADLTVYPAFRHRGTDGERRQQLQSMPLDQLAADIRRRPSQYVAQNKGMRSSVPVWRDRLSPAYLALRAYVVFDGEKFTVLHGALARTSQSQAPLDLSITQGEGSKDAWVLASRPVDHVSLLEPVGDNIALRRVGGELPSRSADNLLWLGRQLERAEAIARLIRSAAGRMSGETRSTSRLEVPLILRCLADQGQVEPGYAVESMKQQLARIEDALPAVIFDRSHGTGLRNILDELLRLGALVRDRVSQDTWRVIHRIDATFYGPVGAKPNLTDLVTRLDDLITGLAALSGILTDSMTRTHTYSFVEIGRRLERSLQVVSMVKNFFIPMPQTHRAALETILEIADSLMTYRSRYLANIQFAPVLDLIITDETNPRSLAFQLTRLVHNVDSLPRLQNTPGFTPPQREAMSMLHAVRMCDIRQTAESHMLGQKSLQALLDEIEAGIPRLFEAISHRYLIHADRTHQLGELTPQPAI